MLNNQRKIRVFLNGMGSVLNLFGSPKAEEKNDLEAIAQDWKNVGKDVQGAIWSYEQNQKARAGSHSTR